MARSARDMGPEISRRLKHFARRAGLSQADISRVLDVTPPTVNQWWTGDTLPTHANLDRLSRLFGIDLSRFWRPLDEECE